MEADFSFVWGIQNINVIAMTEVLAWCIELDSLRGDFSGLFILLCPGLAEINGII